MFNKKNLIYNFTILYQFFNKKIIIKNKIFYFLLLNNIILIKNILFLKNIFYIHDLRKRLKFFEIEKGLKNKKLGIYLRNFSKDSFYIENSQKYCYLIIRFVRKNLFLTLLNKEGNVICKTNIGSCGFKKKVKFTGYAIKRTSKKFSKKILKLFIKTIYLIHKSFEKNQNIAEYFDFFKTLSLKKKINKKIKINKKNKLIKKNIEKESRTQKKQKISRKKKNTKQNIIDQQVQATNGEITQYEQLINSFDFNFKDGTDYWTNINNSININNININTIININTSMPEKEFSKLKTKWSKEDNEIRKLNELIKLDKYEYLFKKINIQNIDNFTKKYNYLNKKYDYLNNYINNKIIILKKGNILNNIKNKKINYRNYIYYQNKISENFNIKIRIKSSLKFWGFKFIMYGLGKKFYWFKGLEVKIPVPHSEGLRLKKKRRV